MSLSSFFAAAAVLAGGADRHQVTVDGVVRYFFVQQPPGTPPSTGWPLIISFHGWCGSASEQAAYDGLRQLAGSEAFVVHPEGYSDPTECHGDCTVRGPDFSLRLI